ncbi:hypothetical protein EUGRSUZ_D02257 [Eucalyptus grandis]|uniref:Uncharacterized protein n=1 Tax=Eucalyptus grandis TaxID=71139 RepID=A0A059CI31_EUCGR|nr:hypothetical protein EUGRSUZ_D02257 [Eucalyptus grandis]
MEEKVCSRDGVEICRKLASSGVAVVLTARDEKRGLQAAQELGNDAGLSANVASLVDFVSTRFGRPDSVVNDAGLGGHITNHDACPKLLNELVSAFNGTAPSALSAKSLDEEVWKEIETEDYGMAEECVKNTNYYKAKSVIEALLPLLPLYQNHFKEGDFGKRGLPTHLAAYNVGKVALNAYTRIMAKKTDVTCNSGLLTPSQGAENPVWLALLPQGGPSGLFYDRKKVSSFLSFPNLPSPVKE